MKKQSIILVIALVFSHLLFAQKPSFKEIQHQRFLPNEDGQLELAIKIVQQFNEFGDVTRQEYFYRDANNNLKNDRKMVYSYDSKGRHQNTLDYNGDHILEKETKIYWDEQNNKNKVEDISYVDGKQTAVSITYLLEYDQFGNKKEEKFFDDKGNVERRRVWSYNKEQEVIKSNTWIEIYNEPRREEMVTFKRDKNGDLSKSVSIEKVNGKVFRKDIRIFKNNYVIRWKKFIEGKLESEFFNEYRDSVIIRQTRNDRKVIDPAKEKKPTVERKKDKEGEIWVTNTEYDVYGNILVSTQSYKGKVVLVTQFVYDDYNNKIRSIRINKELNEKEEERFEYDQYGNISKKSFYKNNKIVSEDIYNYSYNQR